MSVYLGIDVGGTHITMAVSNKDVEIEKTFTFETRSYTSLAEPLEEVISYLNGRKVISCCVGAAGPMLSDEEIHLTHADFVVQRTELEQILETKKVKIVNDFMLVGYALIADESLFKPLTPSKISRRGAKLIIGVGTGLGRCVVVYNDKNEPLVISSEGGNVDFNAKSEMDKQIVEFLVKETKVDTVSYEDILSGAGLNRLHEFFEGDQIEVGKVLASSSKTKAYFAKVLGLFAKNSALGSVAIGGVYFAGGVLIKHPEVFKEETFQRAFIKSKRHLDLLSIIPQYLLSEYTSSAYGACYAAVQLDND